jgi:hypothetical protein
VLKSNLQDSTFSFSQSHLLPIRSNSDEGQTASQISDNSYFDSSSTSYSNRSSAISSSGEFDLGQPGGANNRVELLNIAKNYPQVYSTINSCFEMDEKIRVSYFGIIKLTIDNLQIYLYFLTRIAH